MSVTQENAFEQVHRALAVISRATSDHAGIPVPIEGHPLVIEPRFTHAQLLMGKPEVKERRFIKVRNTFWSMHRRCEVVVWEDPEKGPVQWCIVPGIHHLDQDLRTVGASAAWSIKQEMSALKLLSEHLSEYAFTRYLLTGMFLEASKYSGIHYIFRRLRPTVALAMNGDSVRIIAALCLHPIAYYANSWAGAMCPTDDVLAHLLMMRSDEHFFWRRANQHPAWRPEAGL